MKTLGLLKEPEFETRVCLLPAQVKRLINEEGILILFESGLAKHIGVHDSEYIEAGARVATVEEIYIHANMLLSFNSIYNGEAIQKGTLFIGVYNMLFHKNRMDVYTGKNATVYSLDLLRRSTIGQRMDVLSSMASLSGYQAIINAAAESDRAIPMFTTAAGTLQPAKVLVLGAGVAGLQAIATAKRMGAIVSAFDVRSASRQEVESLGAKFVKVEGANDSDDAGGYALRQSEEYQKKQKALIHDRLIQSDIVITTANIPGQKAPILIEEYSLKQMKKGSIIVDIASEQGGNCELTIDNFKTESGGLKIIGNAHLSRQLPRAASQLLSSNFYAFISHLLKSDLTADELSRDCMVIENGAIVHPRLTKKMELVQ